MKPIKTKKSKKRSKSAYPKYHSILCDNGVMIDVVERRSEVTIKVIEDGDGNVDMDNYYGSIIINNIPYRRNQRI